MVVCNNLSMVYAINKKLLSAVLAFPKPNVNSTPQEGSNFDFDCISGWSPQRSVRP